MFLSEIHNHSFYHNCYYGVSNNENLTHFRGNINKFKVYSNNNQTYIWPIKDIARLVFYNGCLVT